MSPDKFTATWVSHSSITDFLECPRAYYLKNVYKDPKTGHKIQVITPPLALGQVVHEVIEALSVIPTDKRFHQDLLERFEEAWQKVTGKKGGFLDSDTEYRYKERGRDMIRRVHNHPGVLENKAVKINMDLPHFWLSEEENIILCGKIDWLEYNEDNDTINIIDFKTGKNKEVDASLQLPIYMLLVGECQQREVKKMSYWYLETSDEPEEQPLPEIDKDRKNILDIARRIKIAKSLDKFSCPAGASGCRVCRDYEKVLDGEAEYIGVSGYNQDIYIVQNGNHHNNNDDASIIL